MNAHCAHLAGVKWGNYPVQQCIHFKYYLTQIETENTVRNMPNCPKCNSRVTEAMSFCPNCGASQKAAPPPAPAPAPAPPAPPVRQEKQEKQEKREKGEKQEKTEKGEKHEKQGIGLLAPIAGGIVLIMLGVMAFLSLQPGINQPMLWAYFLVIIGIVVIVVAIYGAMIAARRHPPA
jgi:ribosomal protein S27AE